LTKETRLAVNCEQRGHTNINLMSGIKVPISKNQTFGKVLCVN